MGSRICLRVEIEGPSYILQSKFIFYNTRERGKKRKTRDGRKFFFSRTLLINENKGACEYIERYDYRFVTPAHMSRASPGEATAPDSS